MCLLAPDPTGVNRMNRDVSQTTRHRWRREGALRAETPEARRMR